MAKVAVLSILAIVALGSHAHADGTTPTTCEQDPRCYARELAHTLTRGLPAGAAAIERPRLISFEPGRTRVYSQSREKLQAIAEAWKRHADWSVITVRGYAAQSAELAQRRAEKIRGYLIRYGIPAELVVAVGEAGGATVDLSIAVCGDDASEAPRCARTAHSSS